MPVPLRRQALRRVWLRKPIDFTTSLRRSPAPRPRCLCRSCSCCWPYFRYWCAPASNAAAFDPMSSLSSRCFISLLFARRLLPWWWWGSPGSCAAYLAYATHSAVEGAIPPCQYLLFRPASTTGVSSVHEFEVRERSLMMTGNIVNPEQRTIEKAACLVSACLPVYQSRWCAIVSG